MITNGIERKRLPRGWGLVLALVLLALLPAAAVAQTEIFSDDFERADGLLDGWTFGAGSAVILDGRMIIGPTTAENWIWAGNPAFEVPANATSLTCSFDMEFLRPGSNATVGRHGGFAFCGSAPTVRGDTTTPFNGYFVDWIDRVDDLGPRLTRVDVGVNTELAHSGLGNLVNPAPLEPPFEWLVEVDETSIRLYGDGVLYIDVEDSTYRGPYLGFWAYAADQEIAYDNLVVEAELQAVTACFGFTPPNPVTGSPISFDAGCTIATNPIASYSWDFGDGQMGSGETVDHVYDFGDSYTVVLTVEDDQGNTGSTSRVVPVGESLLPFADDFERAPGPVDGWTPHQSEWNITLDGKLNTITAGAEHWVWAGDPAGRISGDFVMEFDMEYAARPADAVGRHAGVMFFSATPTIRYVNSYSVDWIDRTGGAADRGFRMGRVTDGVYTPLVPGAPESPADPPLRWRIEVEGDHIRVYGDGILYIDQVDATYREGHVGFFAYSNGQDVLFDNVVIASELGVDLTACFTTGGLPIIEGESVTFDGTCSLAPDGVEITAYEWDFGDGDTANGATVDHTFATTGTYDVSLTVRSGASSNELIRTLVVHPKVLAFEDDFERADGPVDGWTETQGTWSILGGQLTTGPTAAEHWIWAGEMPPPVTSSNVTFTYDFTFLATPADDVGRHAGLQFHCTRPTQRAGGNSFNGYLVDWIDREVDPYFDRGPRLTRMEGGVTTRLADGGLGNLLADPPAEPPLEWRVVVDGDHILVYGDEVLYIDFVDTVYRGGFFGFWTYSNGQEVQIDNVSVEGIALTPCFTTDRQLPSAAQPIAFDAGCSEVFGGGASITSYAWDFGDGGTASGPTASHTYEFADSYTVTLTVEDDAGGSEVLERVIVVAEDLLPLADCFERPAGPVDGWTVQAGAWDITQDGQLNTITAGAEHWLWAGDPPEVVSGDFVLEYDLEFLVDPRDANPLDQVGRHGGIMFFAQDPTNRGATSGYTVWWIDRTADFGIVLARRDNGVVTQLQAGTGDAILDPPLTWRVEVEGPTIRIYGDDVLYVEVDDDTYREGYFGLWVYSNNQDVVYDNIRMGASTLPECGGSGEPRFVRGDANSDGSINLTDGIVILNFLFLGQAPPACMDAADVDDDGGARPSLTDAIRVFNWLFTGGPPPTPPTPSAANYAPGDCGIDPPDGTPDTMDCAATSAKCE